VTGEKAPEERMIMPWPVKKVSPKPSLGAVSQAVIEEDRYLIENTYLRHSGWLVRPEVDKRFAGCF
jgi:hypothetical protein